MIQTARKKPLEHLSSYETRCRTRRLQGLRLTADPVRIYSDNSHAAISLFHFVLTGGVSFGAGLRVVLCPWEALVSLGGGIRWDGGGAREISRGQGHPFGYGAVQQGQEHFALS